MKKINLLNRQIQNKSTRQLNNFRSILNTAGYVQFLHF